jgi:uncharacterized protein
MTNELPFAHSHAAVTTTRPERYGKQLVSHLGRRNGGEWSAEHRSGWIDLGTGRAILTAEDTKLRLEIHSPPEQLERLQEVIASHLIRFGQSDELEVRWVRAPDQLSGG